MPILTPEDMFKVYSTREMVEAKCAYYAALNADEDAALLENMNRQEHLLFTKQTIKNVLQHLTKNSISQSVL